ncbi:tail fiber protein [Escherichia phage fp01]|uniref:Tail fiber protein n=1 Tax=Escherichia phage fp01 TaxID=2315695 RepID=A0A6C1F785_9CAUD|nr:tail fiber protein [Escherichia phage fp01]QIE02371.1 tail fiber protein [Escherichia phage fp01]
MALRIDKINLKATDVAALPVYGLITTGTNLNTLDGSVYGKYWQSENANSPTSLNYPVAAAGTLLVLKNNASNLATSCTQIYLPYNSNEIYSRSFYSSWTAWSRFASIDMDGANSTIKSLTGLTTALSIEQGGTGVVSKEAFRQSYNVPTKDESLLTENNLSDLADRAAAWLNVRPIGSTPLAGDPVNDYDAVTKRWVENKINTGTVGPTMNGVMNYGVGDFHLRDSRAYIQPYEVVSDGQLLNRADWPELWAYAQMLTPISDAEWLADASKRGKYSLGNGTTTFRVPDRNGVQTGSIQALFGRGDGGNSSSNGVVSESGAPNITYAAPHTMVTLASLASQVATNGAFQSITSGDAPAAVGSGSRYIQTNFDASRCSPVYGRSAAEIVPRNFVGVWVIRASGGFVAANTSWSVMNADAVRPGSGVKALSGQVKAQYKIGTVVEADAGLRCDAYMDGLYYAILSVYNKTKGVTKDLAFDDTGTLSSDRYRARYGTMMAWSETGFTKGTFSAEDQAIGANYAFNSLLSGAQSSQGGYKTSCHWGMIHHNGTSFAQSVWHIAGDANNAYGVRVGIQPLNSDIFFHKWQPGSEETYTLQKNATSDRRLKHSIENTTVEKALENIKNLNFVTFIYNNDNLQRIRRGVIAQETEVIEPLYVKTRKFYDNNGAEQEQKELDTTPMLLDTMHVVQDLIKRIEDLEEELKQLKVQIVPQ